MIRIARLKADMTLCVALSILMLGYCGRSESADKSKIDSAIKKAQLYLLQSSFSGGNGSIAALAYVKSGGDKKNPKVLKFVEEILSKVSLEGRYRPVAHHNYEAGVDVMLLEAVDTEKYRPQMETIVNYLLFNQQPNGSWFYESNIEPDCGDTSITQYVIMGLWAATRAGIEIPVEVWERAAKWHIAKQQDDGGFAYHPFESKITIGKEFHTSTDTMSAAGTSSLLIIRRMLFDDADLAPEIRPVDSRKRFGVLEKFVDERPAGQKKSVKGVPTLRPSSIDKALKESTRWVADHLDKRSPNHEKFFAYHLYTIERVAAAGCAEDRWSRLV